MDYASTEFIPNKQRLLDLAFKAEKYKQYEQAIILFKTIPYWAQDKQTLLSLARCYEEMGQYSEALKTYQTLPNGRQDKQALLSLARCYEEMGQFDQALSTFQSIPNGRQDKQALLGLARCYEEMGQFDQALSIFKTIPNGRQDKQALLSLGRCYEEMGQFDQALEIFQALPNWQKDKQALLGIAYLYQTTREEENLINTVNYALSLYPYETSFVLFQVDYFCRVNDFKTAHQILLEARGWFPYSTPIALSLVYFYLIQENIPAALSLKKELEESFSSHVTFLKKLDLLFRFKCFLTPIKPIDLDADVKIKVNLPEQIRAVFQDLSTVDTSFLLTGSTVLSLICAPETEQKYKDLDFVFNNTESIAPIVQAGFFECPYIKGLFQKNDFINDFKIDLKLSTFKNIINRDFTIGALFCTLEGEIIDPTGQGIKDAKQKILRTIIDPEFSFKYDSVRVLRAIKYITRGFKPTKELEEALLNWVPDTQTNVAHMIAVIKTELSDKQDTLYFEHLCQYKLVEKLYDIGVLIRYEPAPGPQPVLFSNAIQRPRSKSLDCSAIVNDLSDKFAYLNLSSRSGVH